MRDRKIKALAAEPVDGPMRGTADERSAVLMTLLPRRIISGITSGTATGARRPAAR
jgi:hypothetical protein